MSDYSLSDILEQSLECNDAISVELIRNHIDSLYPSGDKVSFGWMDMFIQAWENIQKRMSDQGSSLHASCLVRVAVEYAAPRPESVGSPTRASGSSQESRTRRFASPCSLSFQDPRNNYMVIKLFRLCSQLNTKSDEKEFWRSMAVHYDGIFHCLRKSVYLQENELEEASSFALRFYQLYIDRTFDDMLQAASTPYAGCIRDLILDGLQWAWIFLYASSDSSMSLKTVINNQLQHIAEQQEARDGTQRLIHTVFRLYIRLFCFSQNQMSRR